MYAHIASLTFQPAVSEMSPPFAYLRVPIDRVNLIAGHGIEGDRKAGRNPKRHLNIMCAETVELLSVKGFKVQPGQLGEQMVIAGLDAASLPRGTCLQLGATAVIELTMLRTGCSWFEQIQSKSPDDAEGCLGVMARVIVGGALAVGDRVRVLEYA